MPASPGMRISPGRELRAENHKRGRSFESGISHRDKDDDLALFNEVQNKERENYLLQSNDNFDDIFSTKLRYFSDHKLGISIPTRGESSDLLNVEGDKNDYDWLITPPETPLFRSLDDEASQANLVHRGRTRSQPVPISRSLTMEKDQRSGRGSASPCRLSPSPRSGNSILQSRSKPFPITHSSPPPNVQHISPSRGFSPPSSKPSPPLRSNTPTPRRITAPSRVRGTSPVKTSRANSASPKTKTWQSNIPGFSSEAPPNLRTSLADRPASYVRGSSPMSRNGRKSMSPTASRSASSVVSSGDDLDSLQSFSVSNSGRSAPRGIGVNPSNSPVSLSRKPMKSLSSSAPKRSFDLVRQLDRKGPQNRFRPLLSSVPSSTFYAGNASSRNYSLTSKNSSITTSSNASSDLATSGPHDTERSEQQNEGDITSVFFKGHYSHADDEVFAMDQADDLNEDIDNKIDDTSKRDTNTDMDTTVIAMNLENDYSDANDPPDMVKCSKCGLTFLSSEVITEGDLQFCLECKNSEINSTLTDLETLDQPTSNNISLVTCAGETVKSIDEIANKSQHSYSESSQNLSIVSTQEKELAFATQPSINGIDSSRVVASKSAGISLLLKGSNNVKGHIIQSRSFTASNTSYDDYSYVRDSVNSTSTKSSISASASSSVDLGFSRQTEGRAYRQPSSRKSDMENYRYEMPILHKRSVSSMSGFEEFEEKTCSYPCERSLASESIEAENTFANIENNDNFKTQELSASHEINGSTDFSNPMNVETSSTQSQTFVQEEDAGPPSLCAERLDIAEVPHTDSLGVISEMVIENTDVVCGDSGSDGDSSDSKSCMNELLHDEDIKGTVEEFDISHHARHVREESRILSEESDKTKTGSLMTLEDATDAILFCSSIVHSLAYEAANIAINNESLPTDFLRPPVTILGNPDSERRDNTRSRTMRKRSSWSQKARQKILEMDTKLPPSYNDETNKNSSPPNVKVPNDGDNIKPPPKLESKCNCVIM